MASMWTRVSRSCNNTHIRVAVGLTLVAFVYLLYRRHSLVSPAKSVHTDSDNEKDIELDQQSFNGEIYLPDQQEHGKRKHNRFEDEGDYDEGVDEKEHKHDKALDDLYEFQSDLVKLEMQEVPAYMLQDEKCPACYGDDLCEDIKSGKIKVCVPFCFPVKLVS